MWNAFTTFVKSLFSALTQGAVALDKGMGAVERLADTGYQHSKAFNERSTLELEARHEKLMAELKTASKKKSN